MAVSEKKSANLRARKRVAILTTAACTAAGLSPLLTPGGAAAASMTWANTGITFSAAANWIGGVAPANSTTTDAGVFQGVPSFQPFLSANRSIGALDIQSAGWIFSGSEITLGTGIAAGLNGINSTGNPTGALTFNNGMRLTATGTWTQSLDITLNGLLHCDGSSATRSLTLNGTGGVTLNGDFDFNDAASTAPTRQITVGGTGNMTINGVVKTTTGTGTLRCDTTGTLKLTNVNTYTGGTQLSNGFLNINQDGCLGPAPGSPSAANISVTGSSTLQLANGLGNITLNGNRGIFFSGSASTTRVLRFDTGDNTVDVSSPLTELTGTVSGNFTKEGVGTMIFSSVNSLTGTLNFANGTLIIANSSALGGGSLRWGGGTLSSTAPLTVSNPSVLTNSSHIGGDQTITFNGSLSYSGSTDRTESFDQAAGVVTQVNGGMVISSASGPRQMTIGGDGEVAFNSAISETTGNAGTLRLTNNASITLNVANTYTGGTILDDVDVDLNLGDDNALGTGPVTWNAGSMRSTSAARLIANPITLGLGDTKLVSGPADFTFSGPITLSGGGQRVFSVGTNTASFTNSMTESDGTGFAKAGAGTLVLTGANTYQGGTSVRNGWLKIGNDANLGNAAASLAFGNSGTTSGLSGTLMLSASVANSTREIFVFEDGGTVDTNGSDFKTTGNVSGVGTIRKEGIGNFSASHFRTGGLTINNGAVTVNANGTDSGASQIGALSIVSGPSVPTGTLDLVDNDLAVGNLSYADVTGLISYARNGGNWDRAGITSSAALAASPRITTLGVLTGAEYHSLHGGTATFDGLTISNTDMAVKYTYYGDTDFNGKVDGADYARIDTTFNNETAQGDIGGWVNGDLDYNNKVDGADYALIDSAFNAQGNTVLRMMSFLDGTDRDRDTMTGPALGQVLKHYDQFGEGYALAALSSIPEPGCAAVVFGIVAAAQMRRRRNR